MIAIIDLDSTLIDTVYYKEFVENEFTKQIPKFSSADFIEFVFLRPNADHFLSYCKENFEKLVLCTFSKWSRARIVLDIFNIKDYFDDVIGYEKLISDKTQNFYDDFIMIDDAPWNTIYTIKKLKYLGVDIADKLNRSINDIVVNVLPYDQELDKNRSDNELMLAIEKIKKIMRSEL